MFIENKYYRLYLRLTEKSDEGQYIEKHHRIPKSMGGGGGENIVALTYRKHFLVHWLLTKCTRGNDRKKMLLALYRMTHDRWGNRFLSSWQYEKARKALIEGLEGNQHTLGYRHTDRTKKKISVASSSRIRSEETRNKTRDSVAASWEKRRASGWRFSPEAIEKCREAGRKRKKA